MLKFKLFHLLFVALILIITASVGRKEQKLSSGMIKKLRERLPEANFEKVAMEKQLFQKCRDIFLERQIDDKLQFGHVFENPIGWEQRFEEKDFSENRHRGKVKWANVDGSYGEHYWDINH